MLLLAYVIILLFFAFISGILTILAPFIWPLLPVILSTSASHPSRWRPLGITAGIILGFALFTLAISSIVELFHLNPNWFRYAAVAVLVFFGLTLLLPKLNNWVGSRIGWLGGYWDRHDPSLRYGFDGGLITGLSLGILWSPSAGPILATIASLDSDARLSGQVLLVVTFYIVGIAVPLLGLAYGGQRLVFNWQPLNKYNRQLQIFFGCTTIISALFIASSYDKKIEATLSQMFPQYANTVTRIENVKPVQQELHKLKSAGHGAVSSPK